MKIKKNDNLKVLFTFREQYGGFSFPIPSLLNYVTRPLSFSLSLSVEKVHIEFATQDLTPPPYCIVQYY